MIATRCFLSGGAIDAIHAHVALCHGRDARLKGFNGLANGYTADALAAHVREMAAFVNDPDACRIAAAYAEQLLRRPLYRDALIATALTIICVVLARDGRTLLTPGADLCERLTAVRDGFLDGERLASWLRGQIARRKAPPAITAV